MDDIFYSATEVQAMVRNMDDSKKRHRNLKNTDIREYTKKLIEENQALHFNYPSIFAMHMEDKLNETFFFMLNQKRRIEKGEITEDQASKEVGQRLFNRWVSPVINNTQPRQEMSYSDFYKSKSK